MKEDSSDALAGRLGFKKIFQAGREIEIIESVKALESQKKKIVRSDNNEVIVKTVRDGRVIGMLTSNVSVSKKVMEIIKSNEKALFVPVSQALMADEASRQQKLSRLRSLIRNGMRAKVNICIVSLAEEKEGMLSSAQLLEVANFLGMDEKVAKESLGRLGGLA